MFDFMSLGKGGTVQPNGWDLSNLSKKELATLKSKGVKPVKPPLTGTVLPNTPGLNTPPAGLLGVDPVATQQQARVNPNTPQSKPIYVDSAGNAGRSLPAGSGANVAYGDAAKATPKGSITQAAKGLMGRFGGAVAGPVGLGVSLLGAGDPLGNSERPRQLSPGEIADAQKFAKRVQENSRLPKTGKALLTAGQSQVQPQGAAPAEDMPWPELPVAEGPEAEDPRIAQEREFLSQKVKTDLAEGNVSKAKLAEQAVDAQLQQTGQDVTPKEREELIKKETGFFRKMDNDSLAQYMSTIMMAAGVYTAMMGDGQSAQALFGAASGLRGEKAEREAKAAAAELEERKLGLDERRVASTERDVDSKIGKREVDADVALSGLVLSERGLEVDETLAEETTAMGQARRARLEAETAFDSVKQSIEQQRADAYTKYTEARAKAAEAGSKLPTAPTLTFPQNKELTESYFKAKGLDVDKGVIEAASQQLMNLQKNYPDLTVDEQLSLVTEQFDLSPAKAPSRFLGFDIPLTGSDPKLSLPK